MLPFHESEFKTRIVFVNEPDSLRNEEWADSRDHPDAEAPAKCPRPSAGLMAQRCNLLEHHADTLKDVATGVSRSDLAGAALEYSCAQHCFGFANLMRQPRGADTHLLGSRAKTSAPMHSLNQHQVTDGKGGKSVRYLFSHCPICST
ncbi:hypothetical protein D3C73_916070 [compost metagenome]